ncbi:hypothetical protein FMM80_05225 [Schaedlerella arabinosiphila]|uniref:Uncharacterized protein n=1 Tax=Schaedlerella arabinosiphila TaxID=2044587 RepID=A0A9X5C5V5_9FIRM|nr:hypothetical protein [Schaedlerella arabinosiphila]KAI4442457.1 hypothetical protein C824_004970 [Schaedlerella arabinosiphila]NDO68143.1 hypothetical protein [Schaedlerella arabinosiphila]
METKLPYYMVYPMPFIYDDERLDRRDYEYMRSLYPDTAKRVLPYVEEECDRCEGPNSMIYDEYPDRLQLRLMSGRIYDRVKAEERPFDEHDEEGGPKGVEGQQIQRFCRRDWLRDLIDVMLYQELYKRRGENRRMRQKFY